MFCKQKQENFSELYSEDLTQRHFFFSSVPKQGHGKGEWTPGRILLRTLATFVFQLDNYLLRMRWGWLKTLGIFSILSLHPIIPQVALTTTLFPEYLVFSQLFLCTWWALSVQTCLPSPQAPVADSESLCLVTPFHSLTYLPHRSQKEKS